MPSIKSSIGNNEHISLDDVCSLIFVTHSHDEIGQPIKAEKERQIFCSKLGISRAEFFSAGQHNLKPEMTIVVDSDEYDGEKLLKYEGLKYSIYRVFPRMDGFTELYCEVISGVS